MSEIEVFKEVLLSGTTHYNSKINFTTFHSSKGLEYDTVYIIDPLEKDSKQQTELLEERRTPPLLRGHDQSKKDPQHPLS